MQRVGIASHYLGPLCGGNSWARKEIMQKVQNKQTNKKNQARETERIELLERKILQSRLETRLVMLVRSYGSNSVEFTFHLVLQQTGADV